MPAALPSLATLALLLVALLAGASCRSESPATVPATAERLADAALLRRTLARRCPADRPAPPGLPCDAAARLYAPATRPLWWTPRGPSPQARALARALRHAASRGLDPLHYATGARAVLTSTPPVPPALQAQRDVALSLAALRFVSDLAVGRVKPSEASVDLVPDTTLHDVVRDVSQLARASDVEQRLVALEPPFAAYHRLVGALARYRRLARSPALEVSLPAAAIAPGEALPDAAGLRRRLAATGDLDAASAAGPAGLYDPTLAAGVARFQARHGIDPDGVLGPDTVAALRVPFQARAEQIVLALERFRWLPHAFPAPPIAVNVPEFRLYAMRSDSGFYNGAPDVLTMKVIVGRSWEQQTPVFSARLRRVVFWPYWEVPPSIAREEMLPRLRRDPEYLAQERLDLVGRDETPLAPTPENLGRLEREALRLRQRPGPDNALGLVKFLFPNPYHVYMHGTPQRSLFAHDRRDFSHGCIRVEDPLALAVHVLRDEPGWTRERVVQAMEGPETQEVRLSHPRPVYVLYLTALAQPDGTVHFFRDVYGLDERLAMLLEELPSGS
jgi:murein L,D-transpeptidase YcbB/YkuD